MSLTDKDKSVLKELSRRYMEAASLSVHREKLELWKSLNRGQMQRPMVLIDQIPWNEMEKGDELTNLVTDPYWRWVETDLRQKIYKWKNFPADLVLEPFITIPKSIQSSGYGLNPQAERIELSEGTTAASYHYENMLKTVEDISLIKDIQFTVDEEADKIHLEQGKEIFSGIGPVVLRSGVQFHLGIWDFISQLMSVESAYMQIMDNPDFIHAVLERFTESNLAGIKHANDLRIHDDNINLCHCSHIYTDELLADFGKGKGPVSENCWAFGMAQLFTSVSPETTREFELPYIKRMAKPFGMIYYGCCDRVEDRMDIIREIPNLKKVSCSPWADKKRFVREIGQTLTMSYKPTPAYVAEENVNWEEVRKDLQETYDLAKENKVNLEIILKDISTVRSDPDRLTKWNEIAMEVVKN